MMISRVEREIIETKSVVVPVYDPTTILFTAVIHLSKSTSITTTTTLIYLIDDYVICISN